MHRSNEQTRRSRNLGKVNQKRLIAVESQTERKHTLREDISPRHLEDILKLENPSGTAGESKTSRRCLFREDFKKAGRHSRKSKIKESRLLNRGTRSLGGDFSYLQCHGNRIKNPVEERRDFYRTYDWSGKIDFSLPASFRVLEGARECRLSLSTLSRVAGDECELECPRRQKRIDFFTPNRFTRSR